MRSWACVVATALVLAAMASPARASQADGGLAELGALFPGVYNNEVQYLYDLQTQQPPDNFHQHLQSKIVDFTGKVPAIATAYGAKPSDPIFYIQQWEYSLEQQTMLVYRQRLYQLSMVNGTDIALTIWVFTDPKQFLNAWENPNIFEKMPRTEVSTDLGCRVYFERQAPKSWHSHMLDTCFATIDGKKVRIMDDNWVTEDYLTINEQWYNMDGQHVFGLNSCYNETRQVILEPPTWPLRWHANIMITGTRETSELEVDVIDLGKFYYDWDNANTSGRTAMLMQNITTGEITRDVNLYGVFYYINDKTGSCFHFKIPGVNGPADPNWVHSFAFNETQYLLKQEGTPNARWEATSHWQSDPFNGGPDHLFNYWNFEDKVRTPSRIMGPSFTHAPYGHSFIEIDEYHVSFHDVPDWQKLFNVPANCAGSDTAILARLAQRHRAGASISDAEIVKAVPEMSRADFGHVRQFVDRVSKSGHLSSLLLTSDRSPVEALSKRDQNELTLIESSLRSIAQSHSKTLSQRERETAAASQKLPYPVWPKQFYANHTGNGISYSDIAPLTQRGVFYYDSTKARSCTLYYADKTPEGPKTKQIFEDGWVYRIQMDTGACVAGKIPSSFGMGGPVYPDFMKYFVKQKDQYCLRNRTAYDSSITGLGSITYARTSHWTYWAFAADPAHAFHSWVEIKTGMPFQILGPGPALPPYGLAFLGYENVVPSLDDVDLDDIFHVPASCHKQNQ